MRKLLTLAAALLLTAPVLAQGSVEDLRPEEMRFPDNLGVEELKIPVVPAELLPAPIDSDPVAISNEVFGSGEKIDEAFGAYQRGFYLTALELALPRAERQDAKAQTLIAEIYAQGLGVPQSQERALSWYTLASRNGDGTATFELALMYQNGRGVAKDRARAAELFQRAADAGSPEAKYNLALLLVEGKYVKPDTVRAATLIREAAEAGMAEAQYDYGTMLMEGAGIAPNATLGAEQMKLAAEDGLIDAQVEYATLLVTGNGVAKDFKQAAIWYARAANAGNPVAQNRYAKLLALGSGVDVDLEEAAMWRSLARRQGLADPVLDKLLVSILPEELSRAEERARFWPSVPPTAVAENETVPDLAPAEPATP